MQIPTADPTVEDRPKQFVFPHFSIKRMDEALYHDFINASALGYAGSDLCSALRWLHDQCQKWLQGLCEIPKTRRQGMDVDFTTRMPLQNLDGPLFVRRVPGPHP